MKLSKYDIAVSIERLPGNKPWTNPTLATLFVSTLTRSELVSWHNRLIDERSLKIEKIS